MKNDTSTIRDDLARILGNVASVFALPTFFLTLWNLLPESRTGRIGAESFFFTAIIAYVVTALIAAAYFSNREAKEEEIKKATKVHRWAKVLLFRN